MQSDYNYLLIRTFNDEQYIENFLSNNIAAVGWSDADFIKCKTPEKVFSMLDYLEDVSPIKAGRWKNEIRRFMHVKRGDRIVVPFSNKIFLGIATGEHIFNSEQYDLDQANEIKVNYLRNINGLPISVSRNKISDDLDRRIKIRGMTVNTLNEFSVEIEELFTKFEHESTEKTEDITESFSSTFDEEFSSEIKCVQDVLYNTKIQIPYYQRAYRWEIKNVKQLLDDINQSRLADKSEYRIGSIILHVNSTSKSYDVVDGQQRLTTISLIYKLCHESKQKDIYTFIDRLTFKHSDSFEHIKENFQYIKQWFEENEINKKDYLDYILKNCAFVEIKVASLSEAFQMFDSQNGRGKDLEAYNLLKAYHIRAMELNSQEEKILCDQRWESAVQSEKYKYDILKQLFDEQLYRSRVWSRNKTAYSFSKKKIDEFKGFTIDKNHNTEFPFQNSQLLQYITNKFYKNVLSGTINTKGRFENGESENIDPFVSINQIIVNGKSFFDYIETYVEIYKKLFMDLSTWQLSEFKKFYYKFCLHYSSQSPEDDLQNENSFKAKDKALTRKGDSYLREIYKSLIFVLFDKFGEKGLYTYYETIYRLVYVNRLIKKQVKYDYIAEMPNELFFIIANAKNLAELTVLKTKLNKILNSKIDLDNYDIGDTSVKTFIITGERE